jgi:glycosyltransferase involved in cell wall biosynthesis
MYKHKVSVIIPAYNQCKFLGYAIQSVLDQTYQDFEVLVIDDGSTDDTGEVAKKFRDPRIKYIYQDNQGLSAARNMGIRHAEGEYLTYLDSDDLFLPDKLKLLVSALDSQPEVGFVAGQAIPIDESGNRIGKIFNTPIPADVCQLLIGNPLHVGSVMLRHSWQTRVGFFDETLRSYEDWDMWLRLSVAGCKMSWVAQPVSFYRFHKSQMVRNPNQMTTATFAVLDKTFNDLYLPEKWQQMRNQAYSSAHLRAAMQAYYFSDYVAGKTHLSEAVKLYPEVIDNDAQMLAERLAAFADSPKNTSPLKFLEVIYKHLPDNLYVLRHRRNQDMSLAAVQFAFDAYEQGKVAVAIQAFLLAIRYQPKWLTNRGVVSLLARSIILHLFMSPGRVNSSG